MEIVYSGTFSSNGIQTTNQANTIITFSHPVGNLLFTNEGTTDLNIIFNNEDTTQKHLVKSGYNFEIENLTIKKITIVEGNSKFSYNALYS